MDGSVKICPVCGAEFFPHVEVCNSCNATLAFPEELGRPEKKYIEVPESESDEGPFVMIEEGGFSRLKELSEVLERAGINPKIVRMDCEKEACSGGFGLLVSENVADVAHEVLEDHWLTLHPELKEARALMDEGRCPACGCTLDGAPETCPDCGLNLQGGGP